jgi:hypothetical protein
MKIIFIDVLGGIRLSEIEGTRLDVIKVPLFQGHKDWGKDCDTYKMQTRDFYYIGEAGVYLVYEEKCQVKVVAE